MRFEQPRDLDRRPPRRRAAGAARVISATSCAIGDADAAQQLDALGQQVDQLDLLVVVLIEQQVQLIERRAADLPVVLLVQVAQGHRVGQQLVQRLDVLHTNLVRQPDRDHPEGAVLLKLLAALVQDGEALLFFMSDAEARPLVLLVACSRFGLLTATGVPSCSATRSSRRGRASGWFQKTEGEVTGRSAGAATSPAAATPS